MSGPLSAGGSALVATIGLWAFPGIPPAPELITLRGEIALIDREGQPVEDRAGVVVFLEGVGLTRHSGPPGTDEIVQAEEAFFPSVLPILAGTTVSFPNRDEIFHNIFSLSPARPFDLDIYQAGETRSVAFPNTGLVSVFCNIHPDMAASVLVLSNSFFTVTDADGKYSIPGVPAGSYTLRIWHQLGGETSRSVNVAGAAATLPTVTVREDRVLAPHLNKFGRRYRRKY